MAERFIFTELVAKLGVEDRALIDGLRRAEGRLDKFKALAVTVGRGLRQGAIAFGAIGAAATAAADRVDKAYGIIRAGTGATGSALRGLQADFRSTYSRATQGAEAVARSIALLNTRTGATGSTLRALAGDVSELARMEGADLGATTEAVTTTFGKWNVATDRQRESLSFLYRVGQQTGGSFERLTGLLNANGATLRNFGFDFEQAAALIGKFTAEGVNTERVFSGLRIALSQFGRAGQDPAESLQFFLRAVRDAETQAQSINIAQQVFGSESGADIAVAIRDGRFEIDALLASLRGGKDTIAGVGAETRTFSDDMASLKNRIALVAAPLGGVLLNAFERVSPLIGRAVSFTADWATRLASLDPQIQENAVKMAALAAAIPLVGAAFAALTSPIAVAVAAIAGVGAVARAMGIDVDDVINFVVGLWDGAARAATQFESWVSGEMSDVGMSHDDLGAGVEKVALAILGWYDAVAEKAGALAGWVKDGFSSIKDFIFERVVDPLRERFPEVFDAIAAKTDEWRARAGEQFDSYAERGEAAADRVKAAFAGVAGAGAQARANADRGSLLGFLSGTGGRGASGGRFGGTGRAEAEAGAQSQREAIEGVTTALEAEAVAAEDVTKRLAELKRTAENVDPEERAKDFIEASRTESERLNDELRDMLDLLPKIPAEMRDAFDVAIARKREEIGRAAGDVVEPLSEAASDVQGTFGDAFRQVLRDGTVNFRALGDRITDIFADTAFDVVKSFGADLFARIGKGLGGLLGIAGDAAQPQNGGAPDASAVAGPVGAVAGAASGIPVLGPILALLGAGGAAVGSRVAHLPSNDSRKAMQLAKTLSAGFAFGAGYFIADALYKLVGLQVPSRSKFALGTQGPDSPFQVQFGRETPFGTLGTTTSRRFGEPDAILDILAASDRRVALLLSNAEIGRASERLQAASGSTIVGPRGRASGREPVTAAAERFDTILTSVDEGFKGFIATLNLGAMTLQDLTQTVEAALTVRRDVTRFIEETRTGQARTEAADALEALNAELVEMENNARDVGLDDLADQLRGIAPLARQRLTEDFLQDIDTELLQLTDPFRAAMDALAREEAERLREVMDLGADAARVEALFAEKRRRLIEETLAPLDSFLNEVRFGSIASLPNQERLQNALAEFGALSESVLRGDSGSVGDVASLGREILEIGRLVFATGPEFFDLERDIVSTIEDLRARFAAGAGDTEDPAAAAVTAADSREAARHAESLDRLDGLIERTDEMADDIEALKSLMDRYLRGAGARV